MNILKYTKFFMIFSATLIVLGIFVIITYGFKTSIEYTGGSVFKISGLENYDSQLTEISNKLGFEIKDKYKSDGLVHLKTPETDNTKVQEIINNLKNISPDIQITDLEVIGSSVGLEFAKNSFLAFLISILGIVLFVAYTFNSVKDKISPWYFSAAAIVAIFHDVLAVTSFFSVAGFLYNIEIDALFLTALLTIIGFSLNDTIVVFDRIRENIKKYETSKTLVEIFNLSIFETLNRSIITSFTVIIIMFSLFLLGSGTIKYFSLALVIGIAFGTYSSIFIASPIVLFLKKVKK